MSRIFIIAPEGKTGGIEALFQLTDELLAQGHDAYLVPSGLQYDIKSRTLSSNYRLDYRSLYPKYKTQFTVRCVIEENDKVVIPEIFLAHIDAINLMPCEKYIWWLSVDNCFKDYRQNIMAHPIMMSKDRGTFTHLYQSFYAASFLGRIDVSPCLELKCYIDADLVSRESRMRQPQVLYNPTKDKVFSQQLIAQCPELSFVPLVNLGPNGLRQAFSTAALYVDFGTHPGMDRIPREAALNRVIVVTGKRGAAGNPVDIPIEPIFKFDDDEISNGACARKLREMIAHYPHYVERQNAYRGFISGQRKQFSLAVQNIWGAGAQ